MLANLFNNQETTVGTNQLDKTAELTMVSATIVSEILKSIENNEEMTNQVKLSMQSHSEMDKLIEMNYDLTTVDVEFLKELDAATLDRMVKSQQSKRSRSKSKMMTLENYKSMLTGAVAENLLRLVSGKDKQSVGFSSRMADVTYTDEQLQEIAADQERLRAALRNVQSKKSIAKSKADFDPSSDRWQQLLIAEEQLKSVRIGSAPRASVETNKITELLAGVEDVTSLKGADAKSLLEQVKLLLAK